MFANADSLLSIPLFVLPLLTALGAVSRFLLDSLYRRLVVPVFSHPHRSLPPTAGATNATSQTADTRASLAPLGGIFLINVLGSFLLGLAMQLQTQVSVFSYLAAAALLGGFTTFSTAMVDALRLWHGGRRTLALAVLVTQLLTALGGAWLGFALGNGS